MFYTHLIASASLFSPGTSVKHQTKYRYSLLNLTRIIRETLFDRRPLIEILSLKPPDLASPYQNQVQLALFLKVFRILG